jgi:hypothetical protein
MPERSLTHIGRMDQAASVIATSASALYVSFFPKVFASPVRLPGSGFSASLFPSPGYYRATFVIANSLVTSEKAVHARTRYNLRVVETLVGARILANRLGISFVHAKERPTLREIVGRFGDEPVGGWVPVVDDDRLRAALQQMLGKIVLLKPNTVAQEGVTLETMIEWSGMAEKDFREVYLDWIDGKSSRVK